MINLHACKTKKRLIFNDQTMPPLGNLLRQISKKFRLSLKFNRIYSHFAVELVLIIIIIFAAGTNIAIRTNSERAQGPNKSLFFVYLNNHPNLNPKLVDSEGSINVKLGGISNLTKQVLAASTITKEDGERTNSTPLPTLSGSTLLKPNPASSDGILPKRDIEVYVVRGGDTISTIATAFGISTDTILWENNIASASYIQPGQELRILPTSGIKHKVQKGENMSTIAKKYGVDLEDVLEYNEIDTPEHIFPGDEIVIPNGFKKQPITPERQQYLAGLQRNNYETADVDPNFRSASSGLIWPIPQAKRLSRGYLRYHRAIDVPCNYCAVVASAEGIVELSGWQQGYGYTIVINHGGGLKTRYAHASRLSVKAGQRVNQGQIILTSGNTGRSTGPHLHFEVIQNGRYVNPLAVVPR